LVQNLAVVRVLSVFEKDVRCAPDAEVEVIEVELPPGEKERKEESERARDPDAEVGATRQPHVHGIGSSAVKSSVYCTGSLSGG
jgi:hypothetical protein